MGWGGGVVRKCWGLCYLFPSHLNPEQIQAKKKKKKNPHLCVLCFALFISTRGCETVLVSYPFKIGLSAEGSAISSSPPPPPPAALAERQKLVGVCVTTANICATFKIYETKCCRSTIYLLPHINSLSQRMFYSNFGPLEANISFVRGPEIETAEPYVCGESVGRGVRAEEEGGGGGGLEGRKVRSGGSICTLPARQVVFWYPQPRLTQEY